MTGQLRHETDGSTDQVAWYDFTKVVELNRVRVVDVGLQLERTRPPGGRIHPIVPALGLGP